MSITSRVWNQSWDLRKTYLYLKSFDVIQSTHFELFLHNCLIIYSTRHKETIWETKKHVNKNKSVEWKAKEMLMEKTIKCVFVISQQYLRNFSSTTIQAPDLLIPFIMFSINRRSKLRATTISLAHFRKVLYMTLGEFGSSTLRERHCQILQEKR